MNTSCTSSLCCAMLSHSVMFNSLQPQGPQPTRLLCPWGFSSQEYWSGVVMPSSKGSSQPRDRTQISRIAGRFFTIWGSREAQEYWSQQPNPFSKGSSQPRNWTGRFKSHISPSEHLKKHLLDTYLGAELLFTFARWCQIVSQRGYTKCHSIDRV